ncbi:teichuronic acid biosynthesis protein TuaC [Mesobacillus maritimus]|uniref:teichuronic acid biosynthesis protein TuaC n=1 Tax=Mesobacillus maritimus TaxID=1643336 RepID=UPI00384C8E39
MNVLWITSTYPSDEQPGAGVFHETQVQALARLGVEVTVICPVPRNPAVLRSVKKQYQLHENIPFVYKRKGIVVYRPRYTALPGQLRWSQPDKRIASVILQTMKAQKLKPDLIHAHFAMPSGGAARWVANEHRLPWVLTLHGSDVNIYPHYSPSAKRAFIRAVQGANQVIAVGESLQHKTKALTGRTCTVLPIGVDLARFHRPEQPKQLLRKLLQLPQDKTVITFVGRLTEAKGVFELVEAMNQLPKEVAVVFVGEGPAQETLRQHPDFNTRLFLAGQVENARVKDYLGASDAFVLPSYTEGLPTVVVEALALELPVICTKVGSVPDLFGKHQQLLIEPKSVSSLVDRIHEVLYRQGYPSEVREELYGLIHENYDVNRNALELLDYYQRLFSERLLLKL